jgi:glutathione synthase/RimK-type ligase-like ATP-grasp enzyme
MFSNYKLRNDFMKSKIKGKTPIKELIAKLKKREKKGQYVGSKWNKTAVLLGSREISRFIPKTKILSPVVLKSMLDEYKMVYLKPINGTYGKGVIRIEMHEDLNGITYQYQMGTERKKFETLSSLYHSILLNKMKRKYIVQRGIHLLKYDNRIFDLRIMVQRNLKGVWESTGIIGRVALPNKIVTNYHSGGTPMDITTIFKPYMTELQFNKYNLILKKLGQDIAVILSNTYPMLNMLGIDVGVDTKFYPWIIEVNTNPDLYIFKKLKDKEVFRRIYHYAKSFKRA